MLGGEGPAHSYKAPILTFILFICASTRYLRACMHMTHANEAQRMLWIGGHIQRGQPGRGAQVEPAAVAAVLVHAAGPPGAQDGRAQKLRHLPR